MAHNVEEKVRTKDILLKENVSFDSFLLKDEILRGLIRNGYRKPSPIQVVAIPMGKCCLDLIVKSKSGTGKTLVFAIIALEAVDVTKSLQTLIIVPTREIAVQIEEALKSIGCFIEGLKVESFIGGLPLEDDKKKAKGCHIAVGAPGRLKHLISTGHLAINHVKLFVLDEADKLMESSFQSDIHEMYNLLPQRKQVIALSATYPKKLEKFLAQYMTNPTHANVEIESPVLLGLKQFVCVVNSGSNVVQMTRAKNDILIQLLSKISFSQCLVFSNYQSRAESVSNFLNQKGWNSSFISAAQSQIKRLETVKDLKEFKNRILLSTDLTARGIDAANVDLVINYDMPQSAETYLHRMGRAGRYGSAGLCINLALVGDELIQFQKIAGFIDSKLGSIPKLPDLKEIDSLNLSSIDPTQFEQISAINPAESPEKDSNHQKTKKNYKTELIEDQNEVMNIINGSKLEVNEVCERFSNLDTESLLSSLANGDFNTAEPPDLIKSDEDDLIKSDEDDDDSCRKRKRREKSKSPPANFEKCKQKRIFSGKVDATFCKNKALLSTTKLLCDPLTKGKIDDDSVVHYLDYIKTREEILMNNFVNTCDEEDVVEIIAQENQDFAIDPTNEFSNGGIDNIFAIGYRYAVDLDRHHWLTQIPPEEYKKFQEFCAAEMHEDTEDDDEDEDYGMDEEIEDFPISDNHQPSSSLDHFDLDRNQRRVELNQEQNDRFSKRYNECNDYLWQNGLTFESVDDFDYWYSNEWLRELQSVRNYVQQNIYVDEMSQYQNSLK